MKHIELTDLPSEVFPLICLLDMPGDALAITEHGHPVAVLVLVLPKKPLGSPPDDE